MKNDIKLKLKIQEQQMTLWEIKQETDTWIMFNASITAGKKKPDGTWDNINQGFTCFATGENIKKLKDNFKQRDKIKVSGSITMLPEKRSAVGKNGKEFQETIFSGATISVEKLDFITSENYEASSQKSDTYGQIDDDIPF
jgi:hypothetical protein